MIRRPPTAIAVSSVEVEELKRYRLQQQQQQRRQQQQEEEVGSAGKHQDHVRQEQDAHANGEVPRNIKDADMDQRKFEHPVDRAARLRRERSAAARVEL